MESDHRFCGNYDRVIDACNVYKLAFRNPQKRPLSERNPQIEKLLTDHRLVFEMEHEPSTLTTCSISQRIAFNCTGNLDVYKSVAEEYPGFKLAAGLCNQDSVEHFFSRLRQQEGHNPNPTARMVHLSIRHILSTGYIHGSDRANAMRLVLCWILATEVARVFEVVNEPESLESYEETNECNMRAAVHTIESNNCIGLEKAEEDSI